MLKKLISVITPYNDMFLYRKCLQCIYNS